jgi:hypothetical protein
MSQRNSEHEANSNSHELRSVSFTDKLRELLPDVKFEEPAAMQEARLAVLEALATRTQDPDFLRSVWEEYAKVCEQIVNDATPADADPQLRAKQQIAALVHKALIFREAGNTRRYGEDLVDAEEYALTKNLDEIAEAIGVELDSL